jgi:hypothetical protein
LHKENIIASYTFEEYRLELAVAEALDIDFTQVVAEALGNPFR